MNMNMNMSHVRMEVKEWMRGQRTSDGDDEVEAHWETYHDRLSAPTELPWYWCSLNAADIYVRKREGRYKLICLLTTP